MKNEKLANIDSPIMALSAINLVLVKEIARGDFDNSELATFYSRVKDAAKTHKIGANEKSLYLTNTMFRLDMVEGVIALGLIGLLKLGLES